MGNRAIATKSAGPPGLARHQLARIVRTGLAAEAAGTSEAPAATEQGALPKVDVTAPGSTMLPVSGKGVGSDRRWHYEVEVSHCDPAFPQAPGLVRRGVPHTTLRRERRIQLAVGSAPFSSIPGKGGRAAARFRRH